MSTRLRIATVRADGYLDPSDLAAGGPDESIVQPEWSPDGVLHLVSDRSGWWNLYRLVEGPRLEPLAPMEAEFAKPAWVFDRSTYGFLPDGSIVAVGRARGRDRIFHVAPGRLAGELESPFTDFGALRAGAGSILAIAGSPTETSMLVALDPTTLAPTGVLRRSSTAAIDPAWIVGGRADHVPERRRAHRPRSLLPPDEPGRGRPRRGAAAAPGPFAWRPHVARRQLRSTSGSSC